MNEKIMTIKEYFEKHPISFTPEENIKEYRKYRNDILKQIRKEEAEEAIKGIEIIKKTKRNRDSLRRYQKKKSNKIQKKITEF